MVVPVRALVALALAMLCSGNVPGTAGLTFSGDVDWWRRGVIYQVYPRSFQDGCDVGGACSGTGTLSGITRRLDYLADLGEGRGSPNPFVLSPCHGHVCMRVYVVGAAALCIRRDVPVLTSTPACLGRRSTHPPQGSPRSGSPPSTIPRWWILGERLHVTPPCSWQPVPFLYQPTPSRSGRCLLR